MQPRLKIKPTGLNDIKKTNVLLFLSYDKSCYFSNVLLFLSYDNSYYLSNVLLIYFLDVSTTKSSHFERGFNLHIFLLTLGTRVCTNTR